MQLLKWRHRESITRAEFGKLLETEELGPVAENTVYRWEAGRNKPPRRMRERIRVVTNGHVTDEDWEKEPLCGGGRRKKRTPRFMAHILWGRGTGRL